MKQCKYFFKILFVLWVFPSFSGMAQTVAGAEDTAVTPASPGNPASQEVEVSEDNYRRFMELKDRQQRRNIIPETVFKPQGSLQKIAALQEESQKHLRNQLRDIILQSEQWKPGDELQLYPYIPSASAQNSQSLQRQEAEAWDELLAGYHQREAEIYANATGSEAAMASANGQSDQNEASDDSDKGDGDKEDGNKGDGNKEGGNKGKQAAEASNAGQNGASADSYSPNSSNGAASPVTAGISQNALEFLINNGRGVQQSNSAVGTLAIKDLENARGITVEAGIGAQPDETKDKPDNHDG